MEWCTPESAPSANDGLAPLTVAEPTCRSSCRLHCNASILLRRPASWSASNHPAARYKVFVHSAPKSATTNLGRLLRLSGYRTSGWRGPGGERSAAILSANRFYEKAAKPLSSADRCNIARRLNNWAGLIATHDAFHDTPLGHVFSSELRPGLHLGIKAALWPQARFIWSDRPAADAALSWFRWQRKGGTSPLPPRRGKGDTTAPPESWSERELSRMKEMLAEERAAILALRTAQPWRVLVLPWEGGGLRDDTEETVARWLFGEACAASLKGLLASTPTGGRKMVNVSQSVQMNT